MLSTVLCAASILRECFDQYYESLLACGYEKGRKLLLNGVPIIWEDPREDNPLKRPRKPAMKQDHYMYFSPSHSMWWQKVQAYNRGAARISGIHPHLFRDTVKETHTARS